MKKYLAALLVLMSCAVSPIFANSMGSGLTSNLSDQAQLKSADDAFLFQARIIKPNLIEVTWGADEGYHLYHDKFSFQTNNPAIRLGSYTLPAGKKTYLPGLEQTVEEHTGIFQIFIPFTGQGNFTLEAHAQGCADVGVCYPPFVREKNLKG